MLTPVSKPTPIFESARLYYTRFDSSMASYFFELNNDPEVIRYTGDSPFLSLRDSQIFISNYSHYDKHGYGRWSVYKKDTEEWIGWCGLKYNEENMVDIGFRFFKKEWNNGFATESAQACIKYGFQNFDIDNIIARCDSRNISSIKVINKLYLHFWKEENRRFGVSILYFKITKKQFLNQYLKNRINKD